MQHFAPFLDHFWALMEVMVRRCRVTDRLLHPKEMKKMPVDPLPIPQGARAGVNHVDPGVSSLDPKQPDSRFPGTSRCRRLGIPVQDTKGKSCPHKTHRRLWEYVFGS